MSEFSTYCLGTSCMVKCETCRHEKNWQVLNQLEDALRKPLQAGMRNINTSECQITSGAFYQPASKEQEK